MHAFLIISKNKQTSLKRAKERCRENQIEKFDISLLAFEKTIGIADIREIQEKILFKPLMGNSKAVIVDTYNNITTQAQNALLKILEEPPANTIIILIASQKELLLSTILSRCKIIELTEEKTPNADADVAEFNNILNIILKGSVGDKLKAACDIAGNKGDAALWLEKMSVFLENKLKQNNKDSKLLTFLKEFQKTYKAVKSTNVSQRTALENLFLSF